MRWVLITTLVCLVAPAASAQHDHRAAPSPYTALQDREIKALSAEDVRQLLEGEGMGMALTAELNGYPGPKHTLEFADSLGLTPAQRARTDSLMQVMQANARRLGARLVEAERALDRTLPGGTVTDPALREATAAIGTLRGELGALHLAAHLAMREILTPAQVHRYAALRGYGVARF